MHLLLHWCVLQGFPFQIPRLSEFGKCNASAACDLFSECTQENLNVIYWPTP